MYTSHISCLRKIRPYLKYRGTFLTLLKHHLTRDITFALIRSCGKDVYKEEPSKEETMCPGEVIAKKAMSNNCCAYIVYIFVGWLPNNIRSMKWRCLSIGASLCFNIWFRYWVHCRKTIRDIFETLQLHFIHTVWAMDPLHALLMSMTLNISKFKVKYVFQFSLVLERP